MPTQKQIDYYLDLCSITGTKPEDGYDKWGAQRMFRKICELRALKEKQEQEIAEEPGGLPPEQGDDIEDEPVLFGGAAQGGMSMAPIDYTPEEYDPVAVREAFRKAARDMME